MKATLRATASRATAVRPVASLKAGLNRVASVAGAVAVSVAIATSANAATIKLGADGGGLNFVPDKVTVKAGEVITFVNNAGFPHNIVFDEDEIPSGVVADAISREDYLNAPGQTWELKLTAPGTYKYYCEPHQGAGMVGTITVE